ncbi:MAG: hypothetical protein NZ903_00620 [Candidatus Micrarchaeota archaeon]|nr:hypothetical protein [Candidatus Micrarchaeota archaeon]
MKSALRAGCGTRNEPAVKDENDERRRNSWMKRLASHNEMQGF